MLTSSIVAFIIGFAGGLQGLLIILGGNSDGKEKYFELFDSWTLIAVILILTISLIVITNTARTILKKTPGDLIYNR